MIALQNDATKNSRWRSTAVITPRSVSSGTTQNKCKAPLPTPCYTRLHGSIDHNDHCSLGSFGGYGSKGIYGTRGFGGHPKDAKAVFKVLQSVTFLTKSEAQHRRIRVQELRLVKKTKDKLTRDERKKSPEKYLY